MNKTARAKRQLLLIAVLFLTPFLVAVALRFGGWEPPRTRNYGELLAPPLAMENAQARRDDGTAWTFENIDRHWSLLLQRPADCDARCREAVEVLGNVRLALGRHAEKLHLFQLDDEGPLPPLALSGSLPAPLAERPAALPQVWLVDPHGYLVMRYREGFDPSGLRRDLARLIK